MMRALLLSLCAALPASAASFTITITNTTPTGSPPWSTGLLTLKPLIGIGGTPKLATDAGAWATYQFANSNCDAPNPGCTPTGCEDGNATLLAQRWGLTLGVNAWVVPAIAANNGSASVTFDAPVGSQLSYIAWVNDTSVFDDFVAMHPPGTTQAILSNLQVPLFSGSTPLENVDFVVSGYDVNSTSVTDGSGTTCTPECPTTQANCFVAPGNASYGAAGTLPVPATKPARNVTAVSGNGQVRLAWSNQLPHGGVVVARRAGTAVTWVPTTGTTYSLGQQVQGGGNPTTIAYVENGGAAFTAATDTTGLSNGTRYFYKVFSWSGTTKVYSSGDVPSSLGIFSDPTPKTGSSPLWCYSVGFPSVQQPTTELGSRVFTANNGGSLTANLTQAGTSDGWEAWRPVQFDGGIQSRATLVPTVLAGGNYIIVGDQSGRSSLVRSSDGAVIWSTSDLGDVVQAQPVAQLNAYADAAFKAAHPGRDLVIVATRNASATNNKVYGISSVNGTTVWTYSPGNLDIVSGGMAIDYVRNQVWVAARGTNSVRVLSTLNGAQVASLNAYGAIDYGVNLRFVGGVATEAVVINNAGTVYGIDLATRTTKWSRALGATANAWAFPTNTGVVTTVTGTVRRIDVLPDAGTAQIWSVSAPGAAGVTFDYTNQLVFTGGTGSTLRQINFLDAGVKTLIMPGTATTFGHPTLDSTAHRLHVGTLDGRLCAFPAPFP